MSRGAQVYLIFEAYKLTMKSGLLSSRVCLAFGVFLVGLVLLGISNFMVDYIDHAPIPDALERWGPDGYSYGGFIVVVFGCCGVFAVSVFIELLVGCVSDRGLSLTRWFMIFSIGTVILGMLLIWSNWAIWQEARTIIQNE